MSDIGLRVQSAAHAILMILWALLIASGNANAQIVPKPDRLTAANVHPVAVFGDDERRDILGPAFKAAYVEQIGILHLGGTSFCTASCVAPDAILTASHCLIGTQQFAGPDLTRISFTVGAMPRTATLAGGNARGIRRNIQAGTPALRLKPPIGAAADWALARLDAPVCEAGGLTVTEIPREDIEALAEAGKVYQIAMHRDIAPDKLVRGGPCTLARSFAAATERTIALDFEDPDGILLHSCDTGMGSSGSPLLVDGPDGPEIVGLNVGTYIVTKAATSTSSRDGEAAETSEPIANTAIDPGRFRRAVADFTLATSGLAPPRTQRFR